MNKLVYFNVFSEGIAQFKVINRKTNCRQKVRNIGSINCQSVRILGANIQHNMMWQSHLETGPKALLPRLRKQLGLLKHLGNLIPISIKKLARCLIGSRLSYLMPLWGGGSRNLPKKSTNYLECNGMLGYRIK